jgi:galactose oxidase
MGSSHPLGHTFAPGTHSVEEWDHATSTWVPKAAFAQPRVFQNAVVLPSGELLVLGGSTTDYQNSPAFAAVPWFIPELYDPGLAATPGSGTTTVVAPHARPRVYHSVGALLPDARVALLGGQNVSGHQPAASSVEIYSPPYLFQQGGRPVINSVTPAPSAYGGNVSVDVTWANGTDPTSPIETRFVLMRPASATHHFDFEQRRVELASSGPAAPGTTVTMTVTMPPSERHAPPGYYMLFALQRPANVTIARAWIPSVAATVWLR